MKSLKFLALAVVLAIAGCATQGGGGTVTGPVTNLVGPSMIVPVPQLLEEAVTTCACGQTSGNALALIDYNGWVLFCTGGVPQPPVTSSYVGQVNTDVCRVMAWTNATNQLIVPESPPALAMCPVAAPCPKVVPPAPKAS